MAQDESDLLDLALVLTREMTDNGERSSLDAVLAEFGHSRRSLDPLPEE